MAEDEEQSEYSVYTALPHERLDTWGLVPNTRVWTANNSFEPVQALEQGDYVFGVTFSIEDVMIPDGNDGTELAKAWRPKLNARKVLGVRAVRARAWQMTFGDVDAQYNARRLVGGGFTQINTFPFDHDVRDHDRMVDVHTVLDNPRNGSETRKAKKLDPEWSSEAGEAKYRDTEFTGMPRGDQATIIPYEAYGGQTGRFKTSTREYNRFAFSQIREVDVLHHDQPLVQVMVQPDTQEEFGASEERPRSNMIAMTPFRKESETTQVAVDNHSKSLDGIDDVEDMDEWESYVDNVTNAPSSGGEEKVITEERETDVQGAFHKTKDNEEIAKELKQKYGLEGGFLNGGILIHPPVPAQHR